MYTTIIHLSVACLKILRNERKRDEGTLKCTYLCTQKIAFNSFLFKFFRKFHLICHRRAQFMLQNDIKQH